MTVVLIVRRSLASSTGKALTGWLPGITLDDRGEAQAAAVGELLARLRPVWYRPGRAGWRGLLSLLAR